jgi:hypothetical protein
MSAGAADPPCPTDDDDWVDASVGACAATLEADSKLRGAPSAGAPGADAVAGTALPDDAAGDCETSALETDAKPCATVLEADPKRTVTVLIRLRYCFFIGRGL